MGAHLNLTDKSDIIDDLFHAINNSISIRLRYRAKHKNESCFIVDPYKIILYHDTLYLLARKNDNLILFHISRILEAEETTQEFIRDQNLIQDYDRRLSHCFGISPEGNIEKVRIFFDPLVTEVVKERTSHHSQTIEETNTATILTMNVFANYELASWILGWGNSVKKVEPDYYYDLVKEKSSPKKHN